MLAAAIITVVFASLVVGTWLFSRAEQAQARCEAHVRHIHRLLEVPLADPSRRRRPPAHR